MGNFELLAVVEIPLYVRRIKIAESMNPKYYKKGDKLLKKLEAKIGIDYEWKEFTVTEKGKSVKRDFLVEIDTQERVYKNPQQVGKPRYDIINGQRLHQLTLRDYQRSKIIKAIKEQMVPEVAKLDPITDFPIAIGGELYDTFVDQNILKRNGEVNETATWDLDNRQLFYNKTFQDVLTGCIEKTKVNGKNKMLPTTKVIIPDDHIGFITRSPTLNFVPIEDETQRKLVYKIYKDNRPVIKNSKYYDR